MNDFGGFAGGPVRIPHLYNGHDKTFFFGSYEGLRLPRESPLLESFPSADMRNGNLWNYLVRTQGTSTPAINNYDGTPIPCTGPSNCSVPVSPVAANAIKYLMPLPNSGQRRLLPEQLRRQLPGADFEQPVRRAHRPEYYVEPVDLRTVHLQEPLGDVRSRWQAASASAIPACRRCSAAFSQPEQDRGLTVAYNYTINPQLINEFRGGFNSIRDGLNAGPELGHPAQRGRHHGYAGYSRRRRQFQIFKLHRFSGQAGPIRPINKARSSSCWII